MVIGHSYANINPTVKIPRLRQFVVPHKRKVESFALYKKDTLITQEEHKKLENILKKEK